MLGIMVAVFLVGYLCIAMEHKLQVLQVERSRIGLTLAIRN